MKEKTERFQSTKFLIWTLVAFNILLIVMPANATSVAETPRIVTEEAQSASAPAAFEMAAVKPESSCRADF